jgi:uncharacterized protein
MRAASASWAILLAIAGTTAPAGAQTFMSGIGPVADFTIPLQSFAERKYATIVRQRYDFSCGSAALATLLRYHYAHDVGEDDVFTGMWAKGDREQIRKVGFSLLDMKRYLDARKLRADGFRVSLDQIADTGIPGIALISVKNYRHFVVVKGVNKNDVLVGDPAIGLHVLSRAEFEKAWNGVYFVLNSNQDFGRTKFNGGAQWAAFSRAPVGGRFIDPLSLQALSLTAPFYRDF